MRRYYASLGCVFTGIALFSSPTLASEMLYRPQLLQSGHEITDRLSTKDIPTGDGGFARDYLIDVQETDQIVIDLLSDDFDTVVQLIGLDGSTIAENDDASDGSTNSLLFVRMEQSAKYIVRVKAFGEAGEGEFSLKVTRLQAINE